MKKFIHRNEGFTCQNCGEIVPAANGTCRNHCTACLHSLHVDVYPGDRESKCLGIMTPMSIEFKGGLPAVLVHKCQKCSFVGRNKIVEDDNREIMAEIMEKSAFL